VLSLHLFPTRRSSDLCLACALAADAAVPAQPIPEGPEAGSVPAYLGAPAKPKAVSAPSVPTHPFMAANGRSNIHDDAYMTDTYRSEEHTSELQSPDHV